MINLRNYYEFFSKNRFSDPSQITFFKDGGFAINCVRENALKVFDEECNLIETYSGKAILCASSGVVVVIEDGVGFKAYYKGKLIASDTVKNIARKSCSPHNNGFYFHTDHKTTYVYNISSNGSVNMAVLPIKVFDNYVETDDYGNTVITNSNTHESKCYNSLGNFLLNDVRRIKFLPNHRAIISTSKGADLINYEKSLIDPISLLHSSNPHGIQAFKGGYTVIFEDALVANADNGLFISRFKDEKFVSSGKTKVKDYEIVYNDLSCFWTGGKFDIFEVDEEILFVAYYDERFFPFFIDLCFSDKNIRDADIEEVYELKLYQMVRPSDFD